MSLPLKLVLGASMLVAIVVGIQVFVPSLRFLKRSFFPAAIALLLLGGLLVFLTLRQDVDGMLRFSLILTGITPALFLVSVLLHNAVSALGMLLLKKEFEEPVFFLIAVIGCPLLFVAGAVGSIVLGTLK